jgi:hypothetical protein
MRQRASWRRSVSFFAVFLFVFGLRHVLVALYALGGLTRAIEIELSRVLRTDGAVREQPLEIVAVALRTFRGIAGANELLELVVAAAAFVLVDGHGDEKLPRVPLDRVVRAPLPSLLLPDTLDPSSGRGSAW